MPLTGMRRKSKLAPDRGFSYSGAPHELPTGRTSSTDRQTSRQWDYESGFTRRCGRARQRLAAAHATVARASRSRARAGCPRHCGRDARTTEERSVAQTAQPDYSSRMLNKLPWPVILSEAKNLALVRDEVTTKRSERDSSLRSE